MYAPQDPSQLCNSPVSAIHYVNQFEAQRFARVTICVGLTKRSAISSQTRVVTI